MVATGSQSPHAGFSIIELMIVISIVGILAAIAIPAFDDMIKNNRRTVVVNELVANLSLARAEGAKRNQPVSVCANTSGGGISCTGGTNWSYGWMVFLDPNNDGDIAASTDMIKQYVNDYGDIKVASFGTGPVVIRSINQTSSNGTITVCDKRGAGKARAVIISGNGRARVSETAAGGGALTCPT